MTMLALVLATLTAAAPAVQPPASTASSCPAISIKRVPFKGKQVQLGATLAPAVPDAMFNWSVSAGMIVSGQGTDSIVVDVPAGETLTATLMVMELRAGCPDIASITIDPPKRPKR